MYHLLVGFWIAYFGGGFGMIVYNDAIKQGKRKRVAAVLFTLVAMVSAALFTLIVAFVKI